MKSGGSPRPRQKGDNELFAMLGDKVARESGDPDEALAHCLAISRTARLDRSQFARLVAVVERQTGWKLPQLH